MNDNARALRDVSISITVWLAGTRRFIDPKDADHSKQPRLRPGVGTPVRPAGWGVFALQPGLGDGFARPGRSLVAGYVSNLSGSFCRFDGIQMPW
jgi:hypothetical protein